MGGFHLEQNGSALLPFLSGKHIPTLAGYSRFWMAPMVISIGMPFVQFADFGFRQFCRPKSISFRVAPRHRCAIVEIVGLDDGIANLDRDIENGSRNGGTNEGVAVLAELAVFRRADKIQIIGMRHAVASLVGFCMKRPFSNSSFEITLFSV